jgi:hypothetical protein
MSRNPKYGVRFAKRTHRPNFFLNRLVGCGVQLGPLGTAATDWPIVACPWWLWWWRIWWNEDWQGKPKYSEKTHPSATLSTTNPTWPGPVGLHLPLSELKKYIVIYNARKKFNQITNIFRSCLWLCNRYLGRIWEPKQSLQLQHGLQVN